jgi:hypothetical protein
MGKLKDDDIKWIVNHNGELGVMINNQAFFLYKGESLVHDKTTMLYRPVYKREFGEVCRAPNFVFDANEDWKVLPK